MPRIGVSGASGDLGRRITSALLEQQAPEELTLISRTPEALQQHLARGADVRHGDFRQPESLLKAYRDVDVLMLISGVNVNERIAEHRNAIHAARQAGVRHIVYTSVSGIHPANPAISVSDHSTTEQDLRDCGVGHTILRNAAYAEVFCSPAIEAVVRSGVWAQVAGNGRIAPVSKSDIARCAARILPTPEPHDGATYEISGPELLDSREMTRLLAEAYGKPIRYRGCTAEERLAYWEARGVPRQYSPEQRSRPGVFPWSGQEMVSSEDAVARGFYGILSDHVEFISGQRPVSLREVLRQGVNVAMSP